MKSQLKVSIIIPVYNGSNFLAEAIDSALAQTYKNIEVIVVNDGSTDGGVTKEIALSYGKKIKYYEKQNGGAASALNYGIGKMTGEYFSWLSHDDIYLPNKVKKEVEMLLKHKKTEAVIACNVNVVDEKLALIKENKISNIFNKAVNVFLGLDTMTGLNGCSLLIPKSLFQKVGDFDTELKYTQDYDMWYRLSKEADFYLVSDNLVLSRQHPMQDSVTKTDGCTIESDKLHYLIISDISEKELLAAYNGDIREILNIYDIYYKSGYNKTAAVILSKILKYYLNIEDYDEFNKLLKNNIRSVSDEFYFNNSAFFKNNKKTILFYSNVWVKGGIERVLTIISDQLVEKYNVVIISGYNENNDGYELNPKIKHINVDNNSDQLVYLLLVLCLIYNADIFVGNPNIINSFLNIYNLLKDTNVKTVAYNHYYYFLPYYASWIYPIGQKRMEIYKDVDACIWLTDFNSKIGNLFYQNGVTIPNPSSFEIVKPKAKKEKVILAVGRFYDEIKRIDRILKTFRLILDKDPEVRLVLVGDYNLDFKIPHDSNVTIRQLLKQLNFPEDSIVWAGEQSHVESYYKNASILILTSENEGFPLVVLEAISCGLPCTMFEIPGIDSVKNKFNGFIVPQDDFDGLANCTLEILNNKRLYNKMSQASLEMAENYKIETVVKKWEDLICLLIQDKSKQEIRNDISDKYVNKNKIDYDLVKSIAREYEKSLSMVTNEYEKRNHGPSLLINNCVDIDRNNFVRLKRWGKTFANSIKYNGLKLTLVKIKERIESKLRW